jgi:uncharacterized membrane protein
MVKLCHVIGMWHYVQNDKACGPIEASALQAMLQNGSLGPDALVWKEDMPDWVPARSVAEFAASVPRASAAPPIPPLTLPPRQPAAPTIPDALDVEHNKVFAVLAYLSILFLVPLLVAPHSRFARYHTNQGIVLFIATCILWSGHGIPFFYFIMAPMHSILWPAVLVLTVLGIIHAAAGECKPLPLIGRFQLLS